MPRSLVAAAALEPGKGNIGVGGSHHKNATLLKGMNGALLEQRKGCRRVQP